MKNTSAALTEAIYYILLALQEPLHGYGIMQKTSAMSKGRLILSAGTLYGAISNLLEKGWILPCGDPPTRTAEENCIRLRTKGRKSSWLNSSAWRN